MWRDGALRTVSGERDTGENNCWRAHKGAVSEAEMDADCCVGGQQVQQSERMPYATLRQAKSSKRRRRSAVSEEWLVSVSADICLASMFLIELYTFLPIFLIDIEDVR